MYRALRDEEKRAARGRARQSALADPQVELPEWYLRRWHFHPRGYLSAGGAWWFDAIVSRFYNAGAERRLGRAVATAIARAAGPRPKVLDAGCGGGRLLAALADALREASLTGVDLAPHLLERAAVRLGRRVHADLRHANVAALPFADAAFDAVVASHLLGHIPQRIASEALQEFTRVLRPGGWLFVVEHRWHARRSHGEGRLAERAKGLAPGGLAQVQAFQRLPCG